MDNTDATFLLRAASGGEFRRGEFVEGLQGDGLRQGFFLDTNFEGKVIYQANKAYARLLLGNSPGVVVDSSADQASGGSQRLV